MLFEWRINDIERKCEESSRRLYEIDSLRCDVDRLERANRDLGSECDGLRARIETIEAQMMSM